MIGSPVFSSLVAVLLLLSFVLGCRHLFRHGYWGPRIRSVFRRKTVAVASVVGGLIFAIAWLDSIAWVTQYPEGESVPLEASKPMSLLDRGFSMCVGMPFYEFKEEGYSAPLAKTEFFRKNELKSLHLLGTTQTGHDTFYKVLKGCRPAVMIGTIPLLFSVPLAMFAGICGGYFRGRVDDLVVYFYNTLASIPSLLFLLVLVSALGQGFTQIAVGLGLTGWVGLCRLVRGETLKLREMEYVQAARSLGVSSWGIITRHIVPNLMHIVLISSILAFTGLVLSESILSYLGLGLDNSWGELINHARAEMANDPPIAWNLISASVALFGLVLSINVIGDGIRDVLDSRLSLEGES